MGQLTAPLSVMPPSLSRIVWKLLFFAGVSALLCFQIRFLSEGNLSLPSRSFRVLLDDKTSTPVHGDTAPYRKASLVISHDEVAIRYPAKSFARLQAQPTEVVAGVLSSAETPIRRGVIRATWAHNRSNVFFLVSGEWTSELEIEANHFQDIFWIDDDEDYFRITWKTLAFFRAVHRWIGNAQHILKTDDDAYVNLAMVEDYSRNFATDYVGYCMGGMTPRSKQLLEEHYPLYASGAGYLIADNLLSCMDGVLDKWLSVVDEDANTGLLARHCNASCHHADRIFPWRTEDGGFYTDEEDAWIHHYVKAPEEMTFLHAQACKSRYADTTSCGEGSDHRVPRELPHYCGYRLVPDCSVCLRDDESEERCDGSCHYCPWAEGQCISKSESCIPPMEAKSKMRR
jgi:hypothetical protein